VHWLQTLKGKAQAVQALLVLVLMLVLVLLPALY